MKIDRERCQRAMQGLFVSGTPEGRHGAIADAIAAIQANGETALLAEYIGVKNYAGFGDQREDHRYGFGPRHGHIVFRIGRADRFKGALGPDHVYLLECVRDFGSIEDFWSHVEYGRSKPRANLCAALNYGNKIAGQLKQIIAAIDAATVEAHEEGDGMTIPAAFGAVRQ